MRGDAANLLDQLHAQFPELILMATGRRDEEHSVAMLVSDQRIARVLAFWRRDQRHAVGEMPRNVFQAVHR